MDVETLEKMKQRVRKGKYKSLPHSKQEKRKQRKEWRKRKREAKNKGNVSRPARAAEGKNADLPSGNTVGRRTANQDNKECQNDVPVNAAVADKNLSRGKQMVKLSVRRKRNVQDGESFALNHSQAKIPKGPIPCRTKGKEDHRGPLIKEINRSLLTLDDTGKIGVGTFGVCFSGTYRNEFNVVVKEIKTKDSSRKELERAMKEVQHEAAAITAIGDHQGLPYLFGVCTEQPPFYLVLQYHAVDNQSLTLSKAASTGMIRKAEECVEILRQTCEALVHMHNQGFLHNDLKGNNVVLGGKQRSPVIIDFGKSCQISKSRLRTPKLNVDAAIKRYPHIAPEVHRGEKQTTASDVYSFGLLIKRVLKDSKFNVKGLNEITKRCLSSVPSKRPSLLEVLHVLKNLKF